MMQEITPTTQEKARVREYKAYMGLGVHSPVCDQDPRTCGHLAIVIGMGLCEQTENGERCPKLPEEPTFEALSDVINKGFQDSRQNHRNNRDKKIKKKKARIIKPCHAAPCLAQPDRAMLDLA